MSGFAVIFYQLARQSKNAIEQNRRNESLKLKVQIYEKVIGTCSAAQDAVMQFTNYISVLDLQLLFATNMQGGLVKPRPPSQRYPEYSRLRSQATLGLISVVTMIEQWHVVDPRLSVFRRAIGMGLDSHQKIIFGGPDILVNAMPMDEFLDQWSPPSAADLARYRARMQIELYEMGRLSAWVGDFQIEMQMLLLAELFPNPVERRDPPDPEQFCIRLDRADEIERVLDQSDWGRRAIELEAAAWARFKPAEGARPPDQRAELP